MLESRYRLRSSKTSSMGLHDDLLGFVENKINLVNALRIY
jgi:hypothetical protein